MEPTTFKSTGLVKDQDDSTLEKIKYLLPEVDPHSDVTVNRLYILHFALNFEWFMGKS